MLDDRNVYWIQADREEWIENVLKPKIEDFDEVIKQGHCPKCYAKIDLTIPYLDEEIMEAGLLSYGCHNCNSGSIVTLSVPISEIEADKIKMRYRKTPLELLILTADIIEEVKQNTY